MSARRTSALLAALATAACLAAPAPSAAGAPYGWPVAPFDRPHPVRGGFGDPRTIFTGPPTWATLLRGGGLFQFHDGVDVSAPDGTRVYPIESGVVTKVTRETIVVAGGARTFEYWHLVPATSPGARVEARTTALGRIRRGCGHVHLTELDGGVPVDPLAAGHLTPYADTTKPAVTGISFRAGAAGGALLPELVRGRVEIVAAASDTPSLRVRGEWHGLPVAPAVVEWRLVRADTGRTVVPTRVVFDARDRLPAPGGFWSVYARGTHQNMAVFGAHYSYLQPGSYLFRLTPGGFDTRTLRDGVYAVVVTAIDVRGNSGTLTERFSVHNAAGVVGS